MPLAVTRSTESSGSGMSSAGARSHSTLATPTAARFDRALSSMEGDKSSPYSLPAAPTFCAYRNRSSPAPHPRSNTVSPALASTNGCGFPAPVNDSHRLWGSLVEECRVVTDAFCEGTAYREVEFMPWRGRNLTIAIGHRRFDLIRSVFGQGFCHWGISLRITPRLCQQFVQGLRPPMQLLPESFAVPG
jgi:hypothetical protein